MSGSLFTPKIKRIREEMAGKLTIPSDDRTGSILLSLARYSVIVLVGSVPLFFTPQLWASLGFDKTFLAIIFSLISVIVVSLLVLRRHEVKTVIPASLVLFWSAVALAFTSGLLSGDVQDSMRGSLMETQTVSFLAVMGLVMSMTLVLQNSKNATVKTLAVFGLAAFILLSYNLIRILFGADLLSFSSFNTLTVSPIGGFNDLAIFAGLTIVFGLVTLVQLPLRKLIQYPIAALVFLALLTLTAVNFFNIWLIIGFFGLLLFVYLLSSDTLFKSNSVVPTSGILIVTTVAVCLTSLMFIVAGDYMGAKVSQFTNIDYVEIRPSNRATIDMAQAVYQDNLIFGVGPNRFADAWRQYKDVSINETIFWDTDFNAGSGFVPTLFINLGLVGGVLIVLFHLGFIYLGYRMLLRGTTHDSYWYYFGVVSFSLAVFLWIMSYIYVPGAGILLLTALFTGFSFVAYGALAPSAVKTIPLAINRQRGFILMAAAILLISASVAVLFSVGKQYVAQANFSKAQTESVASFEQIALHSFDLFADDRFISAQAQVKLANLISILSIPEPTEEDQQNFLSTAEQALLFADQAVTADPTDPDNYAVLAGVYSNLALAGHDGAAERAKSALSKSKELDPANPGYYLISAQIAVRTGDFDLAREEIQAALNLKRNFTEALFLSAQLDINEGKVESAIATTRAIITLEPNNPTRYFQLGLLLASNENLTESITAYRTAVLLDPNYANSHYLLALSLISSGQSEEAVEHLKVVQKSNQDNEDLRKLILQIEAGEEIIVPNLGSNIPVSDSAPGSADEAVITSDDIKSNLITPVNKILTPATSNKEEIVLFRDVTSAEVGE